MLYSGIFVGRVALGEGLGCTRRHCGGLTRPKCGGLTYHNPRGLRTCPPLEDLFGQLPVLKEANKPHPWPGLGPNE
jgi:hypothetical protein